MKKIIIAGGPHTGKTTLLDNMKVEYAGSGAVFFVPEPATTVIAEQLSRQEQDPTYEPIMPTTRYREFAGLVVPRSVQLEGAIPPATRVAVLDRSLVDNIAYARLNECHDLVPQMHTAAEAAGYSAVFMCDFVGEYTQTNERREDEATAHLVHDAIQSAYDDFGIDVIKLPAVSVPERLEIVQDVLYS